MILLFQPWTPFMIFTTRKKMLSSQITSFYHLGSSQRSITIWSKPLDLTNLPQISTNWLQQHGSKRQLVLMASNPWWVPLACNSSMNVMSLVTMKPSSKDSRLMAAIIWLIIMLLVSERTLTLLLTNWSTMDLRIKLIGSTTWPMVLGYLLPLRLLGVRSSSTLSDGDTPDS